MNRFLITLASLAAWPLCAETVGDLQFQFPSSQHDWKLLINNVIIENAIQDAMGDEEAEPVEKVCFKLFTHREGDALEMFTATSITNQALGQDPRPLSDIMLAKAQAEDSPVPEEATVQYMQRILDQFFLKLPNHSITILDVTETDDELVFTWELNDGTIDVIHGYSRAFRTKEGQAALNYVTTAPHSEENRSLWSSVLNEAFVECEKEALAAALTDVVEEAPSVSIEETLPTDESASLATNE